MSNIAPDRAAVLCVGGLDPSGGAGLAADVATVAAHGLHPAVVATCLTVQSRTRSEAAEPVAPALMSRQLQAVASDLPVAAVKIGAVPSLAHAETLVAALDALDVPVVLDPVLQASAGLSLGDTRSLAPLLARATLATPNQHEHRALCTAGLDAPGRQWLITGADTDSARVHNRLVGSTTGEWDWPRLPGRYRGSGCTLASAIACQLAGGIALVDACERAQRYTWNALERAWRFADAVHLPQRGCTP